MKYCPYCGTEFTDGAVSFCSECGKSLKMDDGTPKEKSKRKIIGFKLPKKTKGKCVKKGCNEASEELSEATEASENSNYDGYYDDVVPFEDSIEHQTLDKEMVKNIALIAVGVIAVIVICVIMLYIL